MTRFQIDADTFEYRVREEVNRLGVRRFVVQMVSRDGKHPPEPHTAEFKGRRQAERYAARKNVELLAREWRAV